MALVLGDGSGGAGLNHVQRIIRLGGYTQYYSPLASLNDRLDRPDIAWTNLYTADLNAYNNAYSNFEIEVYESDSEIANFSEWCWRHKTLGIDAGDLFEYDTTVSGWSVGSKANETSTAVWKNRQAPEWDNYGGNTIDDLYLHERSPGSSLGIHTQTIPLLRWPQNWGYQNPTGINFVDSGGEYTSAYISEEYYHPLSKIRYAYDNNTFDSYRGLYLGTIYEGTFDIFYTTEQETVPPYGRDTYRKYVNIKIRGYTLGEEADSLYDSFSVQDFTVDGIKLYIERREIDFSDDNTYDNLTTDTASAINDIDIFLDESPESHPFDFELKGEYSTT